MTELAIDAAIDAAELLTHYSFDLGGFTVERLIDYWLREYPANWLRPALVEALYQGRYKAVSVTQILTLWKRRGQPLYHFNHEFERMICGKFSRTSITPSEPPTSGRPSNRTSSLSSDRPAATLPGTPEATKPPSSDKAESSTSKPLEQNPSAAIEAESAEARVDPEPSEQEPLRSPQQSSDRPIRALLPAAKPSVEPSVPSPEAIPPAIAPTGIPESSATSTTAESAEVSREQSPFTVSMQPASSEGKTKSPIQTFKPVNAGIDATELVQWAGDRVSKHPIHQFVPAAGVSNFYAKLKAVVQNRDDFTDLALAGDSVSFQDQRERE